VRRCAVPAVARALALLACAWAAASVGAPAAQGAPAPRAPASAAGAGGRLDGSVRGLPRARSIRFANALAVSAQDGAVAGATSMPAARFVLPLAPGAYVAAVAADARGGGSYTGVSALATVKAGAAAAVKVRVRRASTRAAPASARPRARAAAAGAIYTMGPVTLTAAPHAPIPSYQLSDHVLSAIFDRCTAAGTRFVDTGAALVSALKREQRLSEEGRLASRVRYRPLQPQYRVAGSGTVSRKGEVALELTLTELATGTVVARETASGKAKDLTALLARLTSAFAAGHCTPRPPLQALPVAVLPPSISSSTPSEPSEGSSPKTCPDAGELRAAAANGGAVTLGEGCTVEVAEPVVVASGQDLTIDGSRGARITAEGEDETSLFTVEGGGSLTLEGVTLEDGTAIGADGEQGRWGAQGETGEEGAAGGGVGGEGKPGEDGGKGGDGGEARGGAIENSGTLTVRDRDFLDDVAYGGVGGEGGMGGFGGYGGVGGEGTRLAGGAGGEGGKGGKGGKGGDGGDGGAAKGGAIYNAPGATLTVEGGAFEDDGAGGGFGGNGGEAGVGGAGGTGGFGGEGKPGKEGDPGGSGGIGGEAGKGGDGNDAGEGGDGGSGGAAQGGAIYNAGTMTIRGTRFAENAVIGTDGGAGGDSDWGGPGGTGGVGGRGGNGGKGKCPLEEDGEETNCGANGGNGASGGKGGDGGDGGDVDKGGDNGDGGDGQGGAIYTGAGTLAQLEADGDTFAEDEAYGGPETGSDCEHPEDEEPQLDCPGLGEFSVEPSAPGEGGLGGLEGSAGLPGRGGSEGKAGKEAGHKGAEGKTGKQGEDGESGKAGKAEGPFVFTGS